MISHLHYGFIIIVVVLCSKSVSCSFFVSRGAKILVTSNRVRYKRNTAKAELSSESSFVLPELPYFVSVAATAPKIASSKKLQRKKQQRSRTITGPSPETRPNYEEIHGPMGKFIDTFLLKLFRMKMAEQVGIDSSLPKEDYQGLMELSNALNSLYSDRRQVQTIAQKVLISMFPSWLPGSYSILFSKPFPAFSAKMNAWATMTCGTWLMGECEVNDCIVDGGGVAKNQGVLVKRCRFLEESGPCASMCVNSCKVPTQRFFMENMGLPLTMEPDYETFECQFSFGLTPDKAAEQKARETPCFERCPSAGGMKMWHDGGSGTERDFINDMNQSIDYTEIEGNKCLFMDNS